MSTRIIKSALGKRGWRLISIAASVAAAVAVATSAHADPNAVWQADVYYPVGSVVSYQGRLYEAVVSQIDFHGSEHDPSVSSLWKEIGSSHAHRFKLHGAWFTHTSNSGAPRCALAWTSDNTYTTGGIASVNGVNYRANWWTRGESPVSHSAVSEPWTMIGSCSTSSKTADSATVPPTDADSGSVAQANGARPRG